MRLTLAYDGGAFWGAQVQPGRRTVGSEIEGALSRLTGEGAKVTFAGRTDRGVHADGQAAHVDVTTRLADGPLRRALNAILPRDVVILGLVTVLDEFHARYDACWREYRYRVWNAGTRHPALERTTWHFVRPLDREALNGGAASLLGEHDFAAFAGQGLGVPGREPGRSTIRQVYTARWDPLAPGLPAVEGTLLELQIRAGGFLPQMVRTIVGALVEVGAGRREPGWVATVLRGRDRAAVPAPAPPQGLTLWRVGYGEDG